MTSSRFLSLALPLSLLAVSCGSSSETPSTNNPTDGGGGGLDTGKITTDTGTPGEGGGGGCSSEDPPPAGAVCVKTVKGKVTDIAGKPLPDKIISVCGEICYFGKTGADGSYATEINAFILKNNFAVSAHGRPDHASLYEKMPVGAADIVEMPGVMKLPVLPASGPAIPFDATTRKIATAQSLTFGDVTLKFQADTEVELDLEDAELGDKGKQLRVVKVETADFPTFVKDQNILALYAISPFDSKYTKKVGLSITAPSGLAAGTNVAFVELGNGFLKAPFTAGMPITAAKGKIVGGKAETNAGEGVQVLTWIGIKEDK